jgi:hypothetical protein
MESFPGGPDSFWLSADEAEEFVSFGPPTCALLLLVLEELAASEV